jgi:hypothetical protein
MEIFLRNTLVKLNITYFCVQHGFYRRPLQQRGKVQGSRELLYLRICRRHLGSKQFIDDHDHASWP